MKNFKLWDTFKQWQTSCEWIDLTHPMSEDTPHWVGWDALRVHPKVNLDTSIFNASEYTTIGQYGTHADAPNHMVKGGRSLDQIELTEMILPLCVLDMSAEARENPDLVLQPRHILDWEEKHGSIPEGSFVAFRTDWYQQMAGDMDNLDAEGNRHFPGWSLDALQLLVEERKISAIGHETSDTEAPITSGKTNYEVEYYILAQDKIQVEMLTNLDRCPPKGSIIFCIFQKVVDASGYPARCFALVEK